VKLSSEIRFLDESIKEAFYKLEHGDDSERNLFKVINQAMNNIEENAFIFGNTTYQKVGGLFILLKMMRLLL
jgi:hypothetical protein